MTQAVRHTVVPLKRRADFLRARCGARVKRPSFILQTLPNDTGFVRVGLTVTKKLGGAVTRNRIKRRLRAATAAMFPLHAEPSRDYVLVARPRALTAPWPALLDELRGALLDAREH